MKSLRRGESAILCLRVYPPASSTPVSTDRKPHSLSLGWALYAT